MTEIEWLYCRDNKYRPIQKGLLPLVESIPDKKVKQLNIDESFDADHCGEARAMRLKGYGNAIHAQTAQVFIEAVMLSLEEN